MKDCPKCSGPFRFDRDFPGLVCQQCGHVEYPPHLVGQPDRLRHGVHINQSRRNQKVIPKAEMAMVLGLLVQVREQLGVSKRRFSELSGISQMSLHSWERQEKRMTEHSYQRILKFLEGLDERVASII